MFVFVFVFYMSCICKAVKALANKGKPGAAVISTPRRAANINSKQIWRKIAKY